jgi:hypothetical protein
MRKEEIVNKRQDLSPPEEFLQAGVKKLCGDDYFKPHRHLPCNKIATMTQEAWVILNGQVVGSFYDLDESLIYETTLNNGDCAVIFRGGHSLQCLTTDTLMYEFKTGPYYGPEQDKVFLGESHE